MTSDNDAARIEALQWYGWAWEELYELGLCQGDGSLDFGKLSAQEEAAFRRGEDGIRPDADALAAARQAGELAERERWKVRVATQMAIARANANAATDEGPRNKYRLVYATLDAIARACNADPPAHAAGREE